MRCPTCNVTLVMADRQGVEIDYCPQCRGVWLDRGELDKIIERTAPEARPDERARKAALMLTGSVIEATTPTATATRKKAC